MSEKSNAAHGPFRPGDDVRIKGNILHWQILSIEGNQATLKSGQSGIRRQETLDRLEPWDAGKFRG